MGRQGRIGLEGLNGLPGDQGPRGPTGSSGEPGDVGYQQNCFYSCGAQAQGVRISSQNSPFPFSMSHDDSADVDYETNAEKDE